MARLVDAIAAIGVRVLALRGPSELFAFPSFLAVVRGSTGPQVCQAYGQALRLVRGRQWRRRAARRRARLVRLAGAVGGSETGK